MNQELRDLLEKKKSISRHSSDITVIPIYKVRINYDSGTSEEFWCLSFKSSESERTFTWQAVCQAFSPLVIGVDGIESVHQVGIEYLSKEMQREFDIKVAED